MISPLATTDGFSPLGVSPITLADRYFLYDQYITDVTAGAVNGTLAEPVGGARNVTDTGSKMSIAGGVLVSAQNGAGSATNPILSYSGQTRAIGRVLTGTMTAVSGRARVYWATASKSATSDGMLSPISTNLYVVQATFNLIAASVVENTAYQFAYVLRAAGVFLFLKGGIYTNWTLIYSSILGTTATLYPTINAFLGSQSEDNIRVPKQTYIPVPLQSDGFSTTTTDGLGNPENNGTAGNAYDGVGTPAVAAGVRSFSALSGGGLGVSVLACSSPDVNIEVNVTRTAGSAGIIARRADASNYIQCLHNGTNVIVSQVVAGSATTLSTTAVAYSAGATMKFHVSGTAYRAFYNNAAAGSGTVPASTNTNHGIITNSLTGSFDNLVIWARGNEDQYIGLDYL